MERTKYRAQKSYKPRGDGGPSKRRNKNAVDNSGRQETQVTIFDGRLDTQTSGSHIRDKQPTYPPSFRTQCRFADNISVHVFLVY